MTEKTSRVQLNWLLDQGRNLYSSHWLQTVLMLYFTQSRVLHQPLAGLFTVDFWICHCRENTGVIHNINNGYTWFKCPSKPICAIPGNVFPLIWVALSVALEVNLSWLSAKCICSGKHGRPQQTDAKSLDFTNIQHNLKERGKVG